MISFFFPFSSFSSSVSDLLFLFLYAALGNDSFVSRRTHHKSFTRHQINCTNNTPFRIKFQIPKSNESEMHRVLSYQTAMQINDDRDIRTYITKRTCISLIFSASFFTLILGKCANAAAVDI